jgi:hypothetical protein
MQTIILVTGGIFWILTYIFIISKGFKDKTYGMPLIALCANISWEFIFSFVFPHTPPQLFINYLWFGLDCIIVIQLLKYGKDEFPYLSSKRLYSIFVVLLISEFSLILISGITIGEFKGVYPALDKILLCLSCL